jgi:hypothetical protein
MRALARLACCLILALGSAACGSGPRIGVFGPRRFDATRDHYRIELGLGGRLLPEDWRIDNFVVDAQGRPTQAKWARDYVREIVPDWNGDGVAERPVVLPRHDLSFIHSRDGASLWVQTTPVSARIGERALEVIAHDYVDRVGGGSYIEVDWGAGEIRDRRMATAIRAEGPVEIDSTPGYWVTFEFVSIDQREVDARHRGEWVTVVLLRPPSYWARSDGQPATFRPVPGQTLPILMTVGYASRAEHHVVHQEEFEAFLRRIDIHQPEDDRGRER